MLKTAIKRPFNVFGCTQNVQICSNGFSPLCNITPAAACESSGERWPLRVSGGCWSRPARRAVPGDAACGSGPGQSRNVPPVDWVAGPFSQSPLTSNLQVSGTFLRNNCNVKMDAVVVRARTRRFGLYGGCVGWLTQGEPPVFWIVLGWEQEESEVGTAPFVHFHVICEVNLCPGKAFMFHAPMGFPQLAGVDLWVLSLFQQETACSCLQISHFRLPFSTADPVPSAILCCCFFTLLDLSRGLGGINLICWKLRVDQPHEEVLGAPSLLCF